MKSYLVSWLEKKHAAATLAVFERERPGAWLVWEAGPWRPPSPRRDTLVTGPETRLLSSAESLAIQLESRNGSAEVRLGRDSANDLVIDDATLSRVHLVFTPDAARGWTLRDAGSRNGTKLDGAPVGTSAVPLRPGCSIEAGAVRLTFHDPASLFMRLRVGE